MGVRQVLGVGLLVTLSICSLLSIHWVFQAGLQQVESVEGALFEAVIRARPNLLSTCPTPPLKDFLAAARDVKLIILDLQFLSNYLTGDERNYLEEHGLYPEILNCRENGETVFSFGIVGDVSHPEQQLPTLLNSKYNVTVDFAETTTTTKKTEDTNNGSQPKVVKESTQVAINVPVKRKVGANQQTAQKSSPTLARRSAYSAVPSTTKADVPSELPSGSVPKRSLAAPGDNAVVNHVYARRDGVTFHIAVLHKRKTYWWIAPAKIGLADLLGDLAWQGRGLGASAQAFQRDDLRKASKSGASVLIPSNVYYYFQQVKYSRFLECDQKQTSEFAERYGKIERASTPRFTQAQFAESISKIPIISRDLQVPVFIAEGTLLGWARQCSVIRFTSDVDVFVFGSFASLSMRDRLIAGAVENVTLDLTLGYLENSFQLRVKSKKEKTPFIDIFFLFPRQPAFWQANRHLPLYFATTDFFRIGYLRNVMPPLQKGCSADLLGTLVNLPCNYLEFVRNSYGHDWKVPISDYHYLDPPNIDEFIPIFKAVGDSEPYS